MHNTKASVEDLWSKYQETKSIWKTAEHFNMCGQSVHERLNKNGYVTDNGKPRFTPEEDAMIQEAYRKSRFVRDVDLHALTAKLGRSHHTNVARRARKLGLTSYNRTMTMKQRDASALQALTAIQNGKQPRKYDHVESGWFESASGKRYFMRSGWEFKYAALLETLLKGKAIKAWEYEPDTFWFEKIKTGTRCYTPDFKITHNDGTIEYHEIKGFMDARSKVKLNRMRIYHPKIKIIVIGKTELKASGLI